MKNMKQKMAIWLAAALMMSSMPVTAAGAVLPADADETAVVTDSNEPANEDATVYAVEVKTLSGQLSRDVQGIAGRIAEELLAQISEEEIAETVYHAEDMWTVAEAFEESETGSIWEVLKPFLERNIKDYLGSLLDGAKEKYEELNDKEVYQVVFDTMYEEMMEAAERFFDEYEASTMSLLPLEEKNITLNLKGFTPVELTMVPFSTVFSGEDMTGVKEIAYTYYSSSYEWSNSYSDDYVIGAYPGNVDLSRGSGSYSARWLMIPGGDQLNERAKRYVVNTEKTYAREWLVPTVYTQDGIGNRTNVAIENYYYSDSSDNDNTLNIYVLNDDIPTDSRIYMKFDLNRSLYGDSANRNSIKVYEGKYETAEEAVKGKDITDQIYGNIDMEQTDAGCEVLYYGYDQEGITIVSFDVNGNATGCLPLEVYLGTISYGHREQSYISGAGMFTRENTDRVYASYTSSSIYAENGLETLTYELYEDYEADRAYYFTMRYYPKGESGYNNNAVTAAYVGQYDSIGAAEKSGAEDIKGKLFGSDYDTAGYKADYSKGVYFSIFVGEDGAGQEVYQYCVKTKEGISAKNSGVGVRFTGLVDKNGKSVSCYVIKPKDDSYAEGNYPVIMVGSDVDITELAPEFTTSEGVNLYAVNSKIPEKSGESYHDFSKGAVHYTTASEDGKNQKNVWLTIKQEASVLTTYNLYTNSLDDSEANTRVENGVIYSKREVILENSSEAHDIFLINMGSNTIPKLSVELTSDVLKLDEYWTLSGNHDLSAFSGVMDTTQYGELANMAKVRLKMKEGVVSGEEVTGTLTIKAAGTTIMVLELTGIAGVPVITTDSIPEAVKYVPYGTMIQNSSKYSKTTIKYALDWGVLPDGMELYENGELYGVPKETGTFEFRVKMASKNPNSSMTRTYTLEVKENTDENVDGATDSGYDVTQRIPTVAIGSSGSHDFVSQGVLDEFTDVFLDGEKLVKNVDYEAESGSTRLTIRSQTLTKANAVGTHTLGVEFRTSGEKMLKRAAQNFNVVEEGTLIDSNDSGNGSSGNSNSGGSGSGNVSAGNGSGGSDSAQDNSAGTSTTDSGIPGAAGMTSAETVIYTVMPGDTLSKIAVKYYGDASMWRRIYDDNRDMISNPNRIRVGLKLKIYLSQVGQQEAQTAAAAKRTYTVQRGDSLWKIALRVYGRGWQWRKIYEANRRQIPNTLILRVGQVIEIP